MTKEEMLVFANRLESEGLRGIYDGGEAETFFNATIAVEQAANKIKEEDINGN